MSNQTLTIADVDLELLEEQRKELGSILSDRKHHEGCFSSRERAALEGIVNMLDAWSDDHIHGAGDEKAGIELNQRQRDEIISLLWENLKPNTGHPDRRCTGFGGKTKEGLIACIEGILNTPEKADGELGAASILVELRASVITVKHGEDGVVLRRGVVKRGAWDSIMKNLDDIGVKSSNVFYPLDIDYGPSEE